MDLCSQLIAVTDAYCSATGKARGTLSASLLNRGSRLDEIAKGEGDITTRNFERSLRWLSENWPEDAPWPAAVDRPTLTGAAA